MESRLAPYSIEKDNGMWRELDIMMEAGQQQFVEVENDVKYMVAVISKVMLIESFPSTVSVVIG